MTDFEELYITRDELERHRHNDIKTMPQLQVFYDTHVLAIDLRISRVQI